MTAIVTRGPEWAQFYDGNGRWHRIPRAIDVMAQHLHYDHGKSVRQINTRLGLTDLEVRALLGLENGRSEP